jgi:hypothetical protein
VGLATLEGGSSPPEVLTWALSPKVMILPLSGSSYSLFSSMAKAVEKLIKKIVAIASMVKRMRYSIFNILFGPLPGSGCFFICRLPCPQRFAYI